MIPQFLTPEYYGLDFSFLTYLEIVMGQFSAFTLYVVIGFSLISAFYMKERIGALAAVMYFPVMAGCALISNYIFWEQEVFPGDQDLERVFTATIFGMMVALLMIIVVNNVKEHYQRRSVRSFGQARG